jgi:hypothetical protein
MVLEDAGREALDRGTVADVADLDLTADLAGERAEPILAPGDEHAVPAALRQRSGSGRADPGGRTCDDGNLLHGRKVTQMPVTGFSLSPGFT